MEIRSYKNAIEYLEGFIGKVIYKIDPEYLKHHDPLERMRVLLNLLDNPQEKFKSVLVGGTSGKGSTAYLISHILTNAGYKTGLTISPHLQKVNERLQINGKPISDKEFTKMVSSMVQIIELMKRKVVGAPSYFEILIAMAFLYFVQEKVDIAIVEVGMGGEFDATNTLYPLVAVLTNVSLDHTSVLGGTVQKIARTKVGIIKKNQESRIMNQDEANSLSSIIHDSSFMIRPIVVTGVKQPSVIKIVEDRCKKVGAELLRLGKDFDFEIKKESLEGSVFDLTTHSGRRLQLNDLRLSLLGEHQVENARLTIETVLQLGKFGFKVSEEYIRKALKTAFFPGRFEVIEFRVQSSEFRVILDGAHNPTKMKAFLSTLRKLYPKNPKIFVIAFKKDKNIKGMVKEILQVADAIVITEFSAKTDMDKNASADAFNIKYQISSFDFAQDKNIKNSKAKEIIVVKNSKMAMEKAFERAKLRKDFLIVVTGSLYLVGEERGFLGGV